MSDHVINFELSGNVGIITINYPPVNALSNRVVAEMLSCVQEIKNNIDCRAVVITGAGDKAFMAGADIKEFPLILHGEAGTATRFAAEVHKLFNEISALPLPVIAAVNGIALGGGCELALACDIRIASDDAIIGLPEIKLGIFPGGGGTQRLPRLVGRARAMELLLSGDHLTAAEALVYGLVNKVVPKADILAEAVKMASVMAKRPGRSVALIKQAVDRGLNLDLEQALQVEIELFEEVFQTKDAREGIAAFIEKRKPDFSHE
jgi:enoyl-CoA hydratase